MKRIIIMALVALMTCTAMQATGKHVDATEGNTVSQRRVPNFTRIESVGSIDIVYTQGNRPSVKIVGKAKEVDCVTTYVRGNILRVGYNSGSRMFNFSSGDDVKVYVTSPDLVGVTLRGSGDFESKGKIDSDNLTVEIVGSGDADMKYVICDNFTVNLRGSGDVEVDYLRCATSNIWLRGSGDIEIKQDRVKNTNILLYGSGSIDVKAQRCGVINAYTYGSGDITLKGSARHLNRRANGSGSIDASQLMETR